MVEISFNNKIRNYKQLPLVVLFVFNLKMLVSSFSIIESSSSVNNFVGGLLGLFLFLFFLLIVVHDCRNLKRISISLNHDGSLFNVKTIDGTAVTFKSRDIKRINYIPRNISHKYQSEFDGSHGCYLIKLKGLRWRLKIPDQLSGANVFSDIDVNAIVDDAVVDDAVVDEIAAREIKRLKAEKEQLKWGPNSINKYR